MCHILETELEDNVKAHVLQPDGTYEKVDRRGKARVNSQEQFCQEAVAQARQERRKNELTDNRVFIPVEGHSLA